jgi:hypothetical protein
MPQQETLEQRRKREERERRKQAYLQQYGGGTDVATMPPLVRAASETSGISGIQQDVERKRRKEAYLQQFGAAQPDLETGRGKAQAEAQNLAEQQAKLDILLARADIDPDQRTRLEELKKTYAPASLLGRRKTEERPVVENIGRGVGAGVPKGAAFAFGDLPGAILNIPGTLVPGIPKVGQGLRDWSQEVNATMDEVFDPQGIGGALGDLIGQAAGGSIGYGLVNAKVAVQMLKVLPKGALRTLVEKSATGSIGQRVAGQAVISIPLDAFQAATLEDADGWQKLLQFGVAQSAGAIGAAAIPAPKVKPPPSARPVDLTAPKGEAPSQGTMETIAAGQALAAERNINEAAKVAWKKANPKKKWNDLKREERDAVYNAYRSSDDGATAVAQMQQGVVDVQNMQIELELAGKTVPSTPATPEGQATVKKGAKPSPTDRDVQMEFDSIEASISSVRTAWMDALDDPTTAGRAKILKTQLDALMDYREDLLAHGAVGRSSGELTEVRNKQGDVVLRPVPAGTPETGAAFFDRTLKEAYKIEDFAERQEYLRSVQGSAPDNKSALNITREINRLEEKRIDQLVQENTIRGEEVDASGRLTPEQQTTARAESEKVLGPLVEQAKPQAAEPTTHVTAEPETNPLLQTDKPLSWHQANARQMQMDELDAIVTQMKTQAGEDAPDHLRNIIAAYRVELKRMQQGATSRAILEKHDLSTRKSPRTAPEPETGQPPSMGIESPLAPLHRAQTASTVEPPSPTTSGTGLRTIPGIKPLSEFTRTEVRSAVQLIKANLASTDDLTRQLDLAHDLKLLKARRVELKAESKAAGASPKPKAVESGDGTMHLVDEGGQPILGDDGLPVQVRRDFNDPASPTANTKPVLGESKTTPSLAPDDGRIPNPEHYKAKPKALSDADLQSHIRDLEEKIDILDPVTAEGYVKRLDAMRDELIRRQNPPRTNGTMLYTPPELGGAVAGYALGFMVAPNDEVRGEWALTGALLLGAGGYGVRKYKAPKRVVVNNIPGQAEMRQGVKTQAEIDALGGRPQSLNYVEKAYTATTSPGHLIGKLLGDKGKHLPTHMHPERLIEMFGRWTHQAHAFVYGRPFIEGPDGNLIELTYTKPDGTVVPVKNMQEIYHMVEGDYEGLGNLMAAMTHIEMSGTPRGSNAPLDLGAALAFARSMPENYHVAVREARKLNEALLNVMQQAGLISVEAKLAMAMENWYAPMERVFGQSVQHGPIDAKGKAIGAATPVHSRKGKSKEPVRNPFESMRYMIPRIMRGVEVNKAKLALIDVRNADPDTWDAFVTRAPRTKKAKDNDPYIARVKTIKELLNLETKDAEGLGSLFMSPLDEVRGDKLSPRAYTMSMYRDGVMETYRLDDWIAYAYKSLKPEEFSGLTQFLGAPAQLAKKGITRHPMFVTWMAFFDNFQLWMNSQASVAEGFKPGWTFFEGLQHSFRRSPEYMEIMAGGGIHTLPTAGAQKGIHTRLLDLKTHEGNAVQSAINSAKELNFVEAYLEMLRPVAEAGRLGEALRVRGQGGSVADAVYAGRTIGGNFSHVAPAIRALNHQTMFLNPVVKALDQAAFAAGVNPFRVPDVGRKRAAMRYAGKGFLAFVLPTAYIYSTYMQDEHLNSVRKTEQGRRYWWFRAPWSNGGFDGLLKIRKPQAEGQFFATGTEMILDKMFDDDPVTAGEWLKSLATESSVSLAPVLPAIGISLWANKDLHFGSPIVSRGKEDLESASQSSRTSSEPAKAVSDFLKPVTETSGALDSELWRRVLSPAGLDYLARGFGGMVAQDALESVSDAVRWNRERFLEPPSEWPIVRRILVDYPFVATREVEQFYDNLGEVDRVSRQITSLAETDPDEFMAYWQRHQGQAMQIGSVMKTRQDIIELRQGMENLEHMIGLPPGQKREMRRQMTLMIIEQARMANAVTKAIQAATPQK